MQILFSTVYGSTAEYAHELARRLGTRARSFADYQKGLFPLIVLSPVHGPSIPAARFVREVGVLGRVAVVGVGMSLPEAARRRDQMKAMVPAGVARFYLPGRLNYSQISAAHRAAMFGLVRAVRLKPRKDDNDRAIIESYGRDVDRVDFRELDPIVEWAVSAAGG